MKVFFSKYYLYSQIMSSKTIDQKISQIVLSLSSTQNYQKKLFAFLCIIWTQIALCGLLNPMIFTNPLFKCSGTIGTEAYACNNEDKCVYQNYFTATHDAELYCQNRGARMTIQSIYGIGGIIGVLTVPLLADLKGKWWAVNVSLLSVLGGGAFILIGILNKGYILIGIGVLASGLGASAMGPVSYSLNSDFFSDSLRQKALIYYCAAWGLTDMLMLFIWKLIPYWIFYLVVLILIPNVILYVYFKIFFLQSIHFIVHKTQDFQYAAETLQKLALINKAPETAFVQAKRILQQVKKLTKQYKKQETPTFKDSIDIIKKNSNYIRAIVCLIFIKMGYYSFYYGAQGCLQRTGFNFGVSIFLLGFGQFLGYMTGIKFVPLLNRRLVVIITNIATALMGITFTTQTVQDSTFIASLVLFLAFILSSYYFSAVALLQTQSFQSSIRSTAVGIIFGIGYMVRLGIPFMIGFLNQRGIHPIIACSILILVLGLLPAVLIQETYGYSNLEDPFIKREIQLRKNVKNKLTIQTDFD